MGTTIAPAGRDWTQCKHVVERRTRCEISKPSWRWNLLFSYNTFLLRWFSAILPTTRNYYSETYKKRR